MVDREAKNCYMRGVILHLMSAKIFIEMFNMLAIIG